MKPMEALSLFRVLIRRWYVALPLLAGLGAGLAVYAVGVRPTYRSAATVLVQGPAVAAVGTGLRPANPLLQDDRSVADALGAIASAMSSDPVRQDYRSRGLASDYTILTANNEVTFTVAGRRPDRIQQHCAGTLILRGHPAHARHVVPLVAIALHRAALHPYDESFDDADVDSCGGAGRSPRVHTLRRAGVADAAIVAQRHRRWHEAGGRWRRRRCSGWRARGRRRWGW